ncbi:D-TA family PLP-dependent enzyme [Stappia sp. P2PMeth1]|uniref:D-TA family PLP-dependent enzyme n=1 Tax=Stappia sp. P2PMeth1 TaxID=2003586 RepID=UPI001648E819|nr:D-TA family PLP-dependent enzyme [Stappia sp. P2PMeth1]
MTADAPFQPETPALVLDEAVALANIARFQAHCDRLGLKSRPHIKTHKLPRFAKAQIAAGARGITCQKIGEAEVMADAGIDDILITFNILGEAKLQRLKALAGRIARLAVVADSGTTVDGLASAFADSAATLHVMVECDTGAGRCGVQTPEEAVDLAARIKAAPGLVFAGLMTYPAPGKAGNVERFMGEALGLLAAHGLECPEISSGGSPDMWHAGEAKGGSRNLVTEYRAGTYIYNDRSLVERGACTLDDCALTVHATVVSRPTPTRAVLDAGSKALSSDLLGLTGHGTIIGHPEAQIAALSEEHAVVEIPAGSLAVGDRVRIVPNHCCVVTNLFDRAWLLAADGGVEEIDIAARGRMT